MGRTWEKFSSSPAKKTQKFETATGKWKNFRQKRRVALVGDNCQHQISNLFAWRCHPKLYENLPAPPKHYGVFDVFCRFAKFLLKRKTCGRTRQRLAMTDFHRKVNKFWQRFPKCDPYLTEWTRIYNMMPFLCQAVKRYMCANEAYFEHRHQQRFAYQA